MLKSSTFTRKGWKQKCREYYGFVPDLWQSITELPEPNMKDSISLVDFNKAYNVLKKANVPEPYYNITTDTVCNLCITPAPAKCAKPYCKEEENSMTIQNTERDYLRRELTNVSYAKESEIEKMFRLHNLDTPQTYKDLIDAIKNGKYTLDEKVTKKVDAYIEEHGRSGWGPFYGIKFNLDNAPDYDGFHKAIAERNRQRTIAERIIMTGDAAAGLKALQDFEAWMPAGPAN